MGLISVQFWWLMLNPLSPQISRLKRNVVIYLPCIGLRDNTNLQRNDFNFGMTKKFPYLSDLMQTVNVDRQIFSIFPIVQILQATSCALLPP